MLSGTVKALSYGMRDQTVLMMLVELEIASAVLIELEIASAVLESKLYIDRRRFSID